ncbi:glycerol-3-phosphate acyltransferase 1, mitochondrial-like isoform X4 [Tachypleus tridentatus]|uniref:glycerol-3-phosphate acyltransferase 1, mitochondrial-like isoform X4 n=1 Tax=Tachypleus tridentatus TaxID=6853 RepID=UPI003FD5B7FA
MWLYLPRFPFDDVTTQITSKTALSTCLLSSRRVAMVELIENLRNIYTRWEERAKPKIKNIVETSEKPYSFHSQTVGNSFNRGKKHSKHVGMLPACGNNKNVHPQLKYPVFDSPKYHGVDQYETNTSSMPEKLLLHPFVRSCCPKCVPVSKMKFIDNKAVALGITNILCVPTQNRESGLLTRTFHHAAFVLQRKPVFDYIDVSKKVIRSERVHTAIEETAAEELSEFGLNDVHLMSLRKRHRRRAVEILNRMRSCISSLLLRISGWAMYKILGRILNGIFVNKGQIEALRSMSENKVPLIYLPLHRSHLDYILVTFILYMNDLRAPLVAAGDNLLITFFGMLMRGLGAFFIKRKLDPQKGKKDKVYRAVLQSYMSESMREGHSLEFFVEGGRTRTGKACLPKGGLLSVVVHSVIEGIVEDAYIVPVAISYEKIVDGNFVLEQLGKPKVMENFKHAVRAVWRVLHSNFGSVRVDFCQPFSLREFLDSSKLLNMSNPPQSLISVPRPLRSTPTSGSLYGTDIVVEDSRHIIKALSEHIVYDAAHTTALMSTNVMAFLYLTKHRKGATFQHLYQSLAWLRTEIINRKRDVGFTGDYYQVISHASSLLTKDLVSTETIEMAWSSENENSSVKIVFYKPVIRLPHVLELQYYANAVVSVFLLDSVVANALFAILDKNLDSWLGHDDKLFLSRQQLVNKALMFCDVLQYEFIFTPPCGSLVTAISETVDQLVTSKLLCQTYSGTVKDSMERSWMNRDASCVVWSDSSESDDDQVVVQDQHLQVMLNEESLNILQFYRCILSPYVESYWLAASSLLKLVQVVKEESVFLQEIHKTAKERLHKGLISYEESFAAEQLKNAVKLFQHWKVLECYIQDSVKLYYLNLNYNSEEAVSEIIRKIEEFKV